MGAYVILDHLTLQITGKLSNSIERKHPISKGMGREGRRGNKMIFAPGARNTGAATANMRYRRYLYLYIDWTLLLFLADRDIMYSYLLETIDDCMYCLRIVMNRSCINGIDIYRDWS